MIKFFCLHLPSSAPSFISRKQPRFVFFFHGKEFPEFSLCSQDEGEHFVNAYFPRILEGFSKFILHQSDDPQASAHQQLTRKVYQPIESDDGAGNSNNLTQMSAYPSTSSKANIRGSPAWERCKQGSERYTNYGATDDCEREEDTRIIIFLPSLSDCMNFACLRLLRNYLRIRFE